MPLNILVIHLTGLTFENIPGVTDGRLDYTHTHTHKFTPSPTNTLTLYCTHTHWHTVPHTLTHWCTPGMLH